MKLITICNGLQNITFTETKSNPLAQEISTRISLATPRTLTDMAELEEEKYSQFG